MISRKYHIDSIEYLITNTWAEAKGYLFNIFFGWRKTDSNNYATFLLSKKDWKNIDIKIKYYNVFIKEKGDKE